MTNTTFLKGLKAGDKVVVCITTYGGYKHEFINTVRKITPTGLIKVGDFLFYNTTGMCRGDKHYCLKEATLQKVKELREKEYTKKVLNTIKAYDFEMTNEQAEAIGKILGIPA